MAQFLRIAVTSEGNQLISARGVKLVEQASTTTTVITYGSGSTGADVITITHAAEEAGGYTSRDAIQQALIDAHDSRFNPNVVIDVTMPLVVSGIAIA